jgi:hypothetical protein
MTIYSNKVVQDVIDNYIKKDGEVIEVIEGCLGYGTTICLGDGLKSTIIQEVFLNSWSSGHTIRMYNKLPKKYEKLLTKTN